MVEKKGYEMVAKEVINVRKRGYEIVEKEVMKQ